MEDRHDLEHRATVYAVVTITTDGGTLAARVGLAVQSVLIYVMIDDDYSWLFVT